MSPRLVAATAFEVEEADMVVIVSTVQTLLLGELHHQVDLLRKFLQEGSRLQVVQPQVYRHQSHLAPLQLLPRARLGAFQQVHEQGSRLARPSNILQVFTVPGQML